MTEFDDVRYSGAFRTSKQARDCIAGLMLLHDLRFVQNPGGGEFFNDKIRVQVSLCDDVADHDKIASAIAALETSR